MKIIEGLSMLKDSLMKGTYSNEYYDLLHEMSRLLYRQGIMINILEQLFINMGFPDNEKVKDDLTNNIKSY